MTAATNTQVAITAVHAVTAVGHDAVMTAACVNAGITRLVKSTDYKDSRGQPVTTAPITCMYDNKKNGTQRMAAIAAFSLDRMLSAYFKDEMYRPERIHLFLGGAADNRSGPPYAYRAENHLERTLKKYTGTTRIEPILTGNAAALDGLSRVCKLIAGRPQSLCIVGATDSLLHKSTLGWLEQDRRLKSESPGRHQALVPGQGVGFMICESADHARQREKPVMAVIKGIGLAEEPAPFVSPEPGIGQGLTQAMQAAIKTVTPGDIHTLLCDQNGEHHRARDWHFAQMRCLETTGAEQRTLLRPAEHYGDIGAASGAVLTAIAAEGLWRNRYKEYLLVACADDHGQCGAVVLGKS